MVDSEQAVSRTRNAVFVNHLRRPHLRVHRRFPNALYHRAIRRRAAVSPPRAFPCRAAGSVCKADKRTRTPPRWRARAVTQRGRKARMGLPAKSPQAILWGPRVGGGTTFPARRTLYYTLTVRAPPSYPARKSTIFPRGPRAGAFDAAIRQSTPQEKSGIFLVGTPSTRSYSPLP